MQQGYFKSYQGKRRTLSNPIGPGFTLGQEERKAGVSDRFCLGHLSSSTKKEVGNWDRVLGNYPETI